MTSSSVASNGAEVRAACARLLQCDAIEVQRFAGGRNSQVYRVECVEPIRVRRYVAKQYYSTPDDPRDRLRTEYRALQFLRAHGIANVPAPVAIDPVARCAIYEHINGERAMSQPISPDDVRQAIDFMIALQPLSQAEDARELADASEACFSVAAIFRSLDTRLVTLRRVPEQTPGGAALKRFLDQRFEPLRAAIASWCDAALRDRPVLAEELPERERILSPSDFGFHNALRPVDGRLVFVDFEYFGWDDPAKMIVDFLHHPGMDLAAGLKRQFAEGIIDGFPAHVLLANRVRLVYPLFGLKWCLILLNEFVPQYLRRRSFAGISDERQAELLDAQLSRAERLLDRLGAEYQNNPFSRVP